MKAESFRLFQQLIPDLQDTGVGWGGTCYVCGEKSFRLKVHGANQIEPGCQNCPRELLISEARRLTGVGERLLANGNGNGKHPTPLPTATGERARPWKSARELLEKQIQPLRWVIPGVLPEGLTILGGRPKQGKSWGVYGVGLAVSVGGKAFGKITVPQGDVLYLALEDGERRLQERMNALLRGAPIPDAFDYQVEWSPLAPAGKIKGRQSPDCLSDIQWWLDEHPQARLVVIDTLSRIKPQSKGNGNGNVYEDDYALIAPFQRVAIDRQIGLIMVTHTRKPASARGAMDFLDEIQGSTGVTGCADTIMGLQKARGEQQVALFVRGRDVEEQELLIEWDRDTGDWRLLGEAQEYRRTQLQKAILQALKDANGPTHFRVIAARIGKGDKDGIAVVSTTLWRMAQNQAVTTVGEGFYSYVHGREVR